MTSYKIMESFKYSEPSRINSEFTKSLERILSITGLEDLSLLEKIALKKILVDSCDRADKVSLEYNRIVPHIEAAAIFMDHFYGTPVLTQGDLYRLEDIRLSVLEQTGIDGIGILFKKRQEDAHRP